MIIDNEWLAKHDACASARKLFASEFPHGAHHTTVLRGLSQWSNPIAYEYARWLIITIGPTDDVIEVSEVYHGLALYCCGTVKARGVHVAGNVIANKLLCADLINAHRIESSTIESDGDVYAAGSLYADRVTARAMRSPLIEVTQALNAGHVEATTLTARGSAEVGSLLVDGTIFADWLSVGRVRAAGIYADSIKAKDSIAVDYTMRAEHIEAGIGIYAGINVAKEYWPIRGRIMCVVEPKNIMSGHFKPIIVTRV